MKMATLEERYRRRREESQRLQAMKLSTNPFDELSQSDQPQHGRQQQQTEAVRVQETSFQPYPAIATSAIRSSDRQYQTFPTRRRFRDNPKQRKGSAWNASLVMSVIFGVLCLIPAPICAAAALVFAIQAVEAEKQQNYVRKRKKADWSVSCCILSLLLGILLLAVIAMTVAAVEFKVFTARL